MIIEFDIDIEIDISRYVDSRDLVNMVEYNMNIRVYDNIIWLCE